MGTGEACTLRLITVIHVAVQGALSLTSAEIYSALSEGVAEHEEARW
jgi:hypothetical protein